MAVLYKVSDPRFWLCTVFCKYLAMALKSRSFQRNDEIISRRNLHFYNFSKSHWIIFSNSLIVLMYWSVLIFLITRTFFSAQQIIIIVETKYKNSSNMYRRKKHYRSVPGMLTSLRLSYFLILFYVSTIYNESKTFERKNTFFWHRNLSKKSQFDFRKTPTAQPSFLTSWIQARVTIVTSTFKGGNYSKMY